MGVIVSGARVGGPAANAGLSSGEIILAVDGSTVADLPGFRETYNNLVEQKKELILLDVKRGALTRFVLLKQKLEEEPKRQ
jgi:S1-C subfamily serine protease